METCKSLGVFFLCFHLLVRRYQRCWTSPAAGAHPGEVAAAGARQSPATALRPCGQSCPSAPVTAGTMESDAIMAQSQCVYSLDVTEKLMYRYWMQYYRG